MTSDPRGDRLLLAVRYISGEMEPGEVAAFEDRLAHDQEAREAVAEAVELAGAFAHLSPPGAEVLPLRGRLWRTWPRVAAGVAAACLVLALGVGAWRLQPSP